ncbi:skp1 family, dimerization domain-containing protein [Ditylenchus destructor]|uniref:Skp1 family, dimerization domain-containing protein n=1 Tax=Ditylenchus destructor TaxID=166010 RepID=A0AAD4MPZ2_9BILA|nr:skp1 family, dimerization domain-containing protein [Ditylenchus destructor]
MSSSNLCYILCAFLIFVSQTKAGQYWGNHCGRESRDRNRPIIDAFDAVCYQHDRCQESSTPDWLCSVQVSMGMMQASQQTGQPMPSDAPETSSEPKAVECVIPATIEDEKLIKCQPGDNEGDIVEVPLKQIKQSHTFANMYQDLNLSEEEDVLDPEVKEDPQTRERIWFTLTEYENKFFDVSVDVHAELLTAANYLDIRTLYLYGCQKFAELLKDKSPAEIREVLGLEDDLTDEEKKEIRKRNVWCNYEV